MYRPLSLGALFAVLACAAPTSADPTSPAATTSDDPADESTAPSDDTTTATSTGSTTAQGSGGGSADDTTGGVEEQPRWAQLIRAAPYPKLVIEVDYVEGREPRTTNITELESILAIVLDKPGGVTIVLDELIPSRGENHAWGIDERVDLAAKTSNLAVDSDTIKIHTLSLDGHAIEDDAMDGVLLGVAWGYENIVLFRDTLDGGCNDAVVGVLVEELCAQAELLIWQHEVGHVVGLVDGGLPMVTNHHDPSPGAGKHDASHDCVMWREYEGLDAIGAVLDRLLAGGPAIELDAACLADIDAVK